MDTTTPSLFGLIKSNRDFSLPTNWGKNQFNNSFPASLACYFSSKNIMPIYLMLDNRLNVAHTKETVSNLFGINPLGEEVFYAFESIHTPYEILVSESLPRIDLVVCKIENNTTKPIKGLEIKLTALPDNQTYNNTEENYGSEIVVRPDTIVYLALSIASSFSSSRHELREKLEPFARRILDWRSIRSVGPHLVEACNVVNNILIGTLDRQQPFILQPIWKTLGKKLMLTNNCLDMFVWSDYAFTRLFIDSVRENGNREFITRQGRTVLWLTKMLYDFSVTGKIKHQLVIDELTYDTKNDKAFAVGGSVTKKYMRCSETLSPRVTKNEIRNIILGGGEKLLSPERRFDAAVLGTPGLFEESLT